MTILLVSLLTIPVYYRLAYQHTKLFQQQFYNHRRYFLGLRDSIKFSLLDFLPILIIIPFLVLQPKLLYVSVMLFAIYVVEVVKRKPEIIKLKFTARVYRLLIALAVVIFLMIGIPSYFYPPIYYYLVLGIYLLFPLFFALIAYLMKPLEGSIKNKYLKKAKKKLAEIEPIFVAITGSYGKTSTKEWVSEILSKKYKVLATPKSYNTMMGITKTINESLQKDHQVLVIEVGVDKVGGMDEFKKLFTPNFVIITGIGPQHLKTFKSLDNIAKEKMKLASWVDKNGVIILNGDCSELRDAPVGVTQRLYYGFKENNAYTIKLGKKRKDMTRFSLNNSDFETGVIGDHFLLNIAASIILARRLIIPEKLIVDAVKGLCNADHRLKLIQKEDYQILDDSYNSNLHSFRCAIKTLSSFAGYRVLITPGLVELGDNYYSYNYQAAEFCVDKVDYVIVVGNMKPFRDAFENKKYEEYVFVDDFKSAMAHLQKIKQVGMTVLIENDLPDIYLR